jgi:hypothetical protein
MDEYFLLREKYDSNLNLYFLQEIATNGREVQFSCWNDIMDNIVT